VSGLRPVNGWILDLIHAADLGAPWPTRWSWGPPATPWHPSQDKDLVELPDGTLGAPGQSVVAVA